MKSSTVNTNGLAIHGKTARQESSRCTAENWLKGMAGGHNGPKNHLV